MLEETPVQQPKDVPEDRIPQQSEELSAKKEPATATAKPKKYRLWLKYFFLLILSLSIAGGLVFCGYYFGVRHGLGEQTPLTSTAREITSTLRKATGEFTMGKPILVGGLYLTVEDAIRVERPQESKDVLVLTVNFDNRGDCPIPPSMECRVDSRSFRLKDESGYKQDWLNTSPTFAFLKTEPIGQSVLQSGEKDRGHIMFAIGKDKDTFILTYSQNKETTPELSFTPAANSLSSTTEF